MSGDNDCGYSNETLATKDHLHFLSYTVLNQIYLIVGFGGNVILLIAFYKQSKTEKAYGYQVILTISKAFEVLSFSTFLTTLKCFSGAEQNEADWFVTNYPIMILTARLGPVAHMIFIICSLYLTVSMTADRLFALIKPFVYKNINRTRHQAFAATVCLSIGLFSSVSDAWRYDVATVAPNRYKLVPNEVYVSTATAHAGSHTRTVLRVIGVVGMIALNIAIIVIFRKRSRKVGQMATNDQKEKARRAADRNLLLLNIYQSILMVINQTPHMITHILHYAVPSFTRCEGMIYSPMADAMIMLTDSIDIFILMAANRKMRRMVRRVVLPCAKCNQDVSNISMVQSIVQNWNTSARRTAAVTHA